MKDKQKIYIKGSIERGNEVIKYLENLGGHNSHFLNGKNPNAYYFINPNGIIVNNYYIGSEAFSYVKEFYEEIKLPIWKPECGDSFYYIVSKGSIMSDIWYGRCFQEQRYKFGNCFKTQEEAEAARDKIKEILK